MAALYQTDRTKVIRLAQTDSATTFTWQSAAQTDITTAGFDTQGFSEFTVYVLLGSVASGGTPTIKEIDESSDNSSFTALAGSGGTALTDTDDYKMVVYNMKKKYTSKRYYRVVVSRAGGNTTVDGIIVVMKKAGRGTVTQSTTVGTRETATAPVAGAT